MSKLWERKVLDKRCEMHAWVGSRESPTKPNVEESAETC